MTEQNKALVEAPATPATLPALAQSLPPSLALFLDDKLFDRARMIAGYLARAEGFVPRHLIGKSEACFAVVSRSLTWKLDPYAVAASTYQTPGGSVGFEGKLVQAILENSGKIVGAIKFIEHGDWSHVQGKFIIATSAKGNPYAKPNWKPEAEAGLGVTVRAQVRGEDEPREFRIDLAQAYPRNSTLWATDPRTQLKYLAVRRFASIAAPGLLMGVPFDREDEIPVDPAMRAVDVTPPRPKRSDFADPGEQRFREATESGEFAGDIANEVAAEMGEAPRDPETGDVIVPPPSPNPAPAPAGELAGTPAANPGSSEAPEREPADEFWSRESYEISPRGAKGNNYARWSDEMIHRAGRVDGGYSLEKLKRDNGKHLIVSGQYNQRHAEVVAALDAAEKRIEEG